MNAMLRSIVFILLTVSILVPVYCQSPASPGPEKWEGDIKKFEEQDKANPPQKQGVLFVGSSSIRLWNLEKFFPGKGYINRGFGGSQLDDSVFYANRIVIPYQPKTIFLYAGDNDINSGKNASRVFADFQQFVATVHNRLPNTRIIYISIKTSKQRWEKREEQWKANALIQSYCHQFPFLGFIDADTPLLGADKKPNADFFQNDGLHINDKGYAIWEKLVSAELVKDASSEKK